MAGVGLAGGAPGGTGWAIAPGLGRSGLVTGSNLGWRLNMARGFACEVADGPGAYASLIVRLGDNHAYVALMNRKVPVMPLNARVFLRWPGPTATGRSHADAGPSHSVTGKILESAR